MPIFEYTCPICGAKREKLVQSKSETIYCPQCPDDIEMIRQEVYIVNDVIYGYCYKNANMKDRVRKE